MNRGLPLMVLAFTLVFFVLTEHPQVTVPETPKQPVVVSFWGFSTPAKTMLQLKSEFESRHPNVRVEVQTVPWSSMQEKTLWAIAAGSNVPDVIVGSSEWTGGLASNGALEPLDNYLDDQFFSRYFPATLGIYKFPEVRRDHPGWRGGLRQYGIPLDLDLMMVFYRADLLQPVMDRIAMKQFPTTWSELYRLAAAVHETSATRNHESYLLYLDPEDPITMSMAFLPSSGASFLNQTFSRATFNTTEAVAAFELFGDLLRQHYAIRWERKTMEDPLVLFKSGRTVMNIAGPWYAKYLELKAPEQAGKWRVALFPRRAQGLPTCGLGGACLAMPFNAPHKTQAIELIKFMARDDFALAYFNRVGSPPPQVTAWEDPTFAQPSPYFGGQTIYRVVKQAIETARPLQLMPNSEVTKGPVRWAMRNMAQGQVGNSQAILDEAVRRANAILLRD